MTNILKRGSVETFARLGEAKGEVMGEQYEHLLELVLDQDLAVSVALCDIAPADSLDDISAMFLGLFSPSKNFLPLLNVVVANEVERTATSADLFRRNSVATK